MQDSQVRVTPKELALRTVTVWAGDATELRKVSPVSSEPEAVEVLMGWWRWRAKVLFLK
jgi:hypothetical protein